MQRSHSSISTMADEVEGEEEEEVDGDGAGFGIGAKKGVDFRNDRI